MRGKASRYQFRRLCRDCQQPLSDGEWLHRYETGRRCTACAANLAEYRMRTGQVAAARPRYAED